MILNSLSIVDSWVFNACCVQYGEFIVRQTFCNHTVYFHGRNGVSL
jgi:hypothetical protein